jgi:hypothetical protein
MSEKANRFNDLSALGSVRDQMPVQEEPMSMPLEKKEYQKNWSKNKTDWRKMVAKKNLRWLNENSMQSQFTPTRFDQEVYIKIQQLFDNENKRKWMIHIITNFFPINYAKQATKLPQSRKRCAITQKPLTSVSEITAGDRDKHLAFTGKQTDVVLCGIALQALHQFVYDSLEKYDTPQGHIISYALDQLRKQEEK